MTASTTRLLAFARELQRAQSFEDLVLITRDEVAASLGFQHAWIMVAEHEDLDEMRLIDVAGAMRGRAWEVAPVLKLRGDAMIEEIVRAEGPVVVVDARVDPRTNKELVAQLGNRTIVNIALRLVDKPLGVLGMGSFGDEGCRAPTAAELDHLMGMAGQLSVAAGRLRFLEERRRHEAELRQAELRLREGQKLEAIGRLAGSIAHDFNNLLSVIIGYAAELQSDQEIGEARRGNVTSIRQAAERAAELTRQLLAFARRQVLVPRVVDPNAIVRPLATLLRRLLVDDIDIRLELDPAVWPIEVDPSQLEQVLMNLCLNARDAMPEGGRLTIVTANVRAAGGLSDAVVLAISDTGSGIPDDVISHIFEPFFTTRGHSGGTGLGLSTVLGIVEQSGGSITVDTRAGAGSTFRVSFPKSSRAPEPLAAPEPQTTAPHGSEVVLVVEDEPTVRQIAAFILKRQGYSVLTAASGPEALELAAAHPGHIHLLLTDVAMQPMSGRELARAFAVVRPDTRVLYMSGYTENAIVHRGILDDDVAYLPKPFTPTALGQSVRAVLDRP